MTNSSHCNTVWINNIGIDKRIESDQATDLKNLLLRRCRTDLMANEKAGQL